MLPESKVATCVAIPPAPPFLAMDAFEAYLSFTLTIVSIICLILTLITYSIFSELRNLPGLNLMALAYTTASYQVKFLTTNFMHLWK